MASKLYRVSQSSPTNDSVAVDEVIRKSTRLSYGYGGAWANGISSDLLNIIWSFLSYQQQLTIVTNVCHRWNTLNSGGIGWNGSDNEPFDMDIWSKRDPSPSLWQKLLRHRWKHIESLGIDVEHVMSLLNTRQLSKIRHLQLSSQTYPTHNNVVDEIMTMLPRLESLSIAQINVAHPKQEWKATSSNCWPSLTSLSLSVLYDNSPSLVIDAGGAWRYICQITLNGPWSLSTSRIEPNSLPSLTALSFAISDVPTTSILPFFLASSKSLTSLSSISMNIMDIPLLAIHIPKLKRLELNYLQLKYQGSGHVDGDRRIVASSFLSLLHHRTPLQRGSTNQQPHIDSQRRADDQPIRLDHMGLQSVYLDNDGNKQSMIFDDLLPLMSTLSSFTIFDSKSSHLLKWVTLHVNNGSLPLLQRCHLKEFRMDHGNRIYIDDLHVLSRHQLIIGDDGHMKVSSATIKTLSCDGSSFSSTMPNWHSMTRNSSSIDVKDISRSLTYNKAILDGIFKYIRADARWSILERVCQSWLQASTVDGCGWSLIALSKEGFIPRQNISRGWTYVIGRHRMHNIRHVQRQGYLASHFKMIPLLFPRLSSFHLSMIHDPDYTYGLEERDFKPLQQCLSLTSLTVSMVYEPQVNHKTKDWTWSRLPSSMCHLHLYHHDAKHSTPLAIPPKWQQQLQSLTLHGAWLPHWDHITQPWLSLTTLCYEFSGIAAMNRFAKESISGFITTISHLLPNLVDLQIPHFDNDQLITAIANNQHSSKLKRLDIGCVSPLPLSTDRLCNITSLGVRIDIEAERLNHEIATVVNQLSSVASLRIYGSPQWYDIILILQLLKRAWSTTSAGDVISSDYQLKEIILDRRRRDMRVTTNIDDQWWGRSIPSSQFASFLLYLQQLPNFIPSVTYGGYDDDYPADYYIRDE
jgi:hypothetical protein